jgi:hypothetical protein
MAPHTGLRRRERSVFLKLDNLSLRYDPFPIGLARPVMSEDLYESLVADFPPIDLFAHYSDLGNPGDKFTLSERESPKVYADFVRGAPVWRESHRYIKSDAFVDSVLDTLKEHYVNLGYWRVARSKRVLAHAKSIFMGRLPPTGRRLRGRFEFSALCADGGCMKPHTDAPAKLVTLVISMARKGEWDPAFGGGTDVNAPKHQRLRYNQDNQMAEFADMEVLHTYPYEPNQAVVFVKTFNSWHSVRPMARTGSTALRRTLTVNIERLG